AGLGPADVTFAIEEGPAAGFVSAATEPISAAGGHRFVVGAGTLPGEYHVVAHLVSDGSLVARARFRVTAHWPDDDTGPAVVLTGKQEVFARGFWGGGPTGPQNINRVPAPELWRVLVVLVNVKDRAFPDALGPAQTTWKDMVVGGRSMKTFYEEASGYDATLGPATPLGTTMDIVSGAVLGPVRAEVGWGDAFEPMTQGSTWGGWKPKTTFWQECATAVCARLQDDGIAETLLRQTDAVVFVVRTASDEGVTIGDKAFPAKYVWPQASGATFWWKTPFSTSFIRKPAVFMPDILPLSIPAAPFAFDEALSHELGHTLGLEDLYNRGGFPAEISVREASDLDHMSSNGSWPYFSLPNKMRLGWIDPAWIETFDFGQNPNGRAVTLHASEALTRTGPPPGRRAGIEVRIRDGWNYYFEYRRTQMGQIGDQSLAATAGNSQIVVGTDVNPDGAALPARPPILLLAVDADGEGPVLDAANEDYEETDITNPTRLHDFRLIFDQIDLADPNAAQVRVEYVRAHRPELQISPAPGRGNWKSPDIDLLGPLGDNRVAKGLRHTIVARVHNRGSLAADNVKVSLAWLPFTTSPGGWTNLADPPRQTVAAGATVTFQTEWDIPAGLKINDIEVEHFCVKASIEAFVDPLDPSHNEIVISNNWAQSNFNTTGVSHGSPSERRWTGLSMTNQLDTAAIYLTVPEQDSDHFRAYVGQAWLRLGAGETKMVEVAYESLAGDPEHGAAFDLAFREHQFEQPARLAFTSFLMPPGEPGCAAPVVQWGAELHLRPGQRTWIEDFRREGEIVRGQVYGSEDGVPQTVGRGRVNVVFWTDQRPERQLTAEAAVEPSGRFTVLIPQEMMAVIDQEPVSGEALYLGTIVWAPCRSGPWPLT
ncbi:MAG: hypothetical protein H0V24_14845, partial [Chloroflexia bacterium]|nr:hypothetical protein [Chloroflexia bacterium]